MSRPKVSLRLWGCLPGRFLPTHVSFFFARSQQMETRTSSTAVVDEEADLGPAEAQDEIPAVVEREKTDAAAHAAEQVWFCEHTSRWKRAVLCVRGLLRWRIALLFIMRGVAISVRQVASGRAGMRALWCEAAVLTLSCAFCRMQMQPWPSSVAEEAEETSADHAEKVRKCI